MRPLRALLSTLLIGNEPNGSWQLAVARQLLTTTNLSAREVGEIVRASEPGKTSYFNAHDLSNDRQTLRKAMLSGASPAQRSQASRVHGLTTAIAANGVNVVDNRAVITLADDTDEDGEAGAREKATRLRSVENEIRRLVTDGEGSSRLIGMVRDLVGGNTPGRCGCIVDSIKEVVRTTIQTELQAIEKGSQEGMKRG